MRVLNFKIQATIKAQFKPKTFLKCFHTSSITCSEITIPLKDKRNIGIIAHIDAGKTTTTERLLYYTNNKKSIGNVDAGDTTTDFLKEERARGITIQSACISIFTKNKLINVIDTPGHIDFSYEVVKSLKVLDGAVLILDSSMGVEAQTLTVFKQAHSLPKVCYINKMDSMGTNFNKCLKDIMLKLESKPLVLTYPIFSLDTVGLSKDTDEDKYNSYILTENDVNNLESNDKFVGVLDVINGCATIYKPADPNYLKVYTYEQLNPNLKKKLELARNSLVETLTSFDSSLLDYILESEIEDYVRDPKLTAKVLNESIRKLTIQKEVIPVVCGSSFQNIGVHNLIDSILEYLPSPIDSVKVPEVEYQGKKVQLTYNPKNDNLDVLKTDKISMAQVFKIVKYPILGNLVYFRVYSGSFTNNSKVFNSSKYTQLLQNSSDSKNSIKLKNVASGYPIKQLYLMQGNLPIKTKKLNVGDIGCVAEKAFIDQTQISLETDFEDLKTSSIGALSTGDTIISGTNGISGILKSLPTKDSKSYENLSTLKITPVSSISHPYKLSIQVLKPNKFHSLITALLEIRRIDPSIDFQYDELLNQIVLEGLGELHLEIVVKRLLDSTGGEDPGYGFGNDVAVGDISVSFMEKLKTNSQNSSWAKFDSELENPTDIVLEVFDKCKFDYRFDSFVSNESEEILEEIENYKANGYVVFNTVNDNDNNYVVVPQNLITNWNEFNQMSSEKFITCLRASCLGICTKGGFNHNLPLRSFVFVLSEENFEIATDFNDASKMINSMRTVFSEHLKKTYSKSDFELQEPFVDASLSTEEKYISSVSHDLTTKRQAIIESIGNESETTDFNSEKAKLDTTKAIENFNSLLYVPKSQVGDPEVVIDLLKDINSQDRSQVTKTICFKAPIRKMTGYMPALRKLTQGKCTLDVSFKGYNTINPSDVSNINF
ncbi:hypothetical protein FOG48_00763 [Hanseniaspora uvarum]|nr:hypothetical protein FOG48_00763 [Hanseniaspora uvarum]